MNILIGGTFFNCCICSHHTRWNTRQKVTGASRWNHLRRDYDCWTSCSFNRWNFLHICRILLIILLNLIQIYSSIELSLISRGSMIFCVYLLLIWLLEAWLWGVQNDLFGSVRQWFGHRDILAWLSGQMVMILAEVVDFTTTDTIGTDLLWKGHNDILIISSGVSLCCLIF